MKACCEFGATFGSMERFTGQTLPLDRRTVMGRSIIDRKSVHIHNLLEAGDEFPLGRQLATKYGHRTTLSVPLLREGRALGSVSVRRAEVRPFDDKEITLLTTFADQAAIAIENVRLFKELQQRTSDLSEALEQQTPLREVLQVISTSPGELQPVFETMLEERRANLRRQVRQSLATRRRRIPHRSDAWRAVSVCRLSAPRAGVSPRSKIGSWPSRPD